MKPRIIALGALAAVLVATDASAQFLNLSGQYQCIQGCMPPMPLRLSSRKTAGTSIW
jgi:hypothetical protein